MGVFPYSKTTIFEWLGVLIGRIRFDAHFARKQFRRLENRKLLYKVSYSDLAKTLRLYASGRDPTITIQKIVKELEMTIQPVRNERAFPRILKPRSFTPFIYRAA